MRMRRRFNRIFSLIIIIILIVGVIYLINAIWITPVSKASKIKTVDYAKENASSENNTIFIKLEDQEQNMVILDNISKMDYSDEWIEAFNYQITQLQKEFPKGKYWNHMSYPYDESSVTSTPCNHKAGVYRCNVYNSASTRACGFSIGGQCAGFASMLSDRIFGKDAPVRKFYNYDEIRVGDQARIDNNGHTVFIIEKTDDYVVVAECNADYKTCIINWGRKIPRNRLNGFYLTRWEK